MEVKIQEREIIEKRGKEIVRNLVLISINTEDVLEYSFSDILLSVRDEKVYIYNVTGADIRVNDGAKQHSIAIDDSLLFGSVPSQFTIEFYEEYRH